MEKVKVLLTTGEFCKLCDTTKDTLFHYEKLNLLKPVKIADNGYRYYVYDQLDLFLNISLLKGIGLSLKQIQMYFSSQNQDALRELLHKQETLANSKIQMFQLIKKYIQNKQHLLTQMDSIVLDEICQIEVKTPEFFYVSGKTIETANEIAIHEIKKLFEEITVHDNIVSTYVWGCLLETHDILRYGRSTPFRFCSKFLSSDNQCPADLPSNKIHIKFPGTYLTIRYKGNFETSDTAYIRLIEFASSNHLKLGNHFYEYPLTDPLLNSSTKNDESYLIELSVQIMPS